METSLQEIILLVTFLISLLSFAQRPTPLYLKLFPLYFLTMLASEIRGEYLVSHGKYNTGLYNISVIVEFCFYYFFLLEIVSNSSVKRIMLSVIFIYPVLAALNLIFFQKQAGFNSINFAVGCVVTVFFCIYYFIELFQDAESRTLARLPSFWIVTAIFFDNVCLFPMFTLISMLKHVPDFISNNLTAILAIVSILTSILYSIGILCRIRIRKSIL
jgi:hypothetical protein